MFLKLKSIKVSNLTKIVLIAQEKLIIV